MLEHSIGLCDKEAALANVQRRSAVQVFVGLSSLGRHRHGSHHTSHAPIWHDTDPRPSFGDCVYFLLRWQWWVVVRVMNTRCCRHDNLQEYMQSRAQWPHIAACASVRRHSRTTAADCCMCISQKAFLTWSWLYFSACLITIVTSQRFWAHRHGTLRPIDWSDVRWWEFLGGPLGATELTNRAFIAQRIGLTPQAVCNITGQVLLLFQGNKLLNVHVRVVCVARQRKRTGSLG